MVSTIYVFDKHREMEGARLFLFSWRPFKVHTQVRCLQDSKKTITVLYILRPKGGGLPLGYSD